MKYKYLSTYLNILPSFKLNPQTSSLSESFIKLFGLIFLFMLSANAFGQAPEITKDPSTQGVIEGQTATFTVEASGDGLSYQWYKDGSIIDFATGSSYTTPATTLADNEAEFSVSVTNGSGSVSSDPAILYVTASGSRVNAGQLALYNFNEGSGTTINDVSGIGDPLNLTINNPSQVDWSPVSLLVRDDALINSTSIATKIISAAQTSNEITIEVWIRPLSIRDDRIFILSQSNTEVNFGIETLPPSGYNFAARTTSTNNQGIPGVLEYTGASSDLTHLIFTFKDGISKIYKNGVEVASDDITGDFSNWNTQARLSLASMLSGLQPWKGIFYLGAIYDRALDPVEVVHNFSIGITEEQAPFIIEDPQNKKVVEGLTATFKVQAIGNTPLSYQWQKNGVDIPGAINSSYTTPATTLADNGSTFKIIVTNSDGSDISQDAVLEVVSSGLVGCYPGMVHYYKLEENSSPYLDSFGFTNAVSSNPPILGEGIVGNGQNFSNEGTINIPDDDLLDWSSNESFSIEFWMKDNSISVISEVIVGRDDPGSSGPNNVHWWVGLNTEGKPQFTLFDNYRVGTFIAGTNNLTDNEWHHVAAVRDGAAATNYLYVDGSVVASTSITYDHDFSANNLPVNIGWLNSDQDYNYNGLLDEVAIFNTALTQAEIQRHYAYGLDGYDYCETAVIDAPILLTAQAKFMRVELKWNDNSDNEDGFIMERSEIDPFPSPFTVIDTITANCTTYVDGNVGDMVTYKYRVKAYNSTTESDYSNEALVTTLLSSVNAPGNLTAVLNAPDTTKVKLSWDDNSTNELGFIIQRAMGDTLHAIVFVSIDTVGADRGEFIDSTVEDMTMYTYRICAYNVNTISPFSNKTQITTLLPVELTSFRTSVSNGKVVITWETATEINNSGFSLEGSKDNQVFTEIAFIKGKGTTTDKSVYSYVDNSVLSGKYIYRLKQIDFDGTYEYSKSIEVDLGMPREITLGQNYPNPFNPTTTIRYSLPGSARVSIKIYNTLGQEIAELVNKEIDAGTYEATLNASDFSSGIYFYRLEAKGIDGSNLTLTKRMLLIK